MAEKEATQLHVHSSILDVSHFTIENGLFELDFTNSSEILKVKFGVFLHIITVEENSNYVALSICAPCYLLFIFCDICRTALLFKLAWK